MTQEEANLLFKDICGRLRSGLVCSIYREDDEGFGWRDAECKGYFQNNDSYEFYFEDVIAVDNIERLKPYLRPMSSMTEEEKKELKSATCPEGTGYFDEQYLICPMSHFGEHISYDFMSDILNWLNAKHFDYRGLIERGLAIEASEEMYNTKIK